MRRSRLPFLLVLLFAVPLWAGGCDPLREKLQESIGKRGSDGSGGSAGASTPPGDPGTPVPPPAQEEPGPDKPLCMSSAECADGRTCSTEWGACLSPPGCGGDKVCPAVCYGTCESGPPACQADADCRLFSDYCTGCDCRALGKGDPEPVCAGPGVRCLVDPCQNKIAVCAGGQCVVKDPGAPEPKCAETAIAGDETTCKSEAEWKQVAHDACLAQGLELVRYSVGGGDCGQGRTNQVKYECCAAPLPGAPPPP